MICVGSAVIETCSARLACSDSNSCLKIAISAGGLLALNRKMLGAENKTGTDASPKGSGKSSDNGADSTAHKKPTPGRELFVEFEGKSVNLDQLWELLRINKAIMDEDNPRTVAIREAIRQAQTLREEKMDPDQRASFVHEVLQKKTAESTKAQEEVQKLTEAVAEANKKLAEASEAATRIAGELARVQASYDEAVAKEAEFIKAKKVRSAAEEKPEQQPVSNTANDVYAAFVQKQLFRDWFQKTSPINYGFCAAMDWHLPRFPKEEIDKFSLWETH